MKRDDPNRPQQFLGNVENVAGRDINFFGPASEWTGLPLEVLHDLRAQQVEAYKKCRRKRYQNGPFFCMLTLSLILLGIGATFIYRFLNLSHGGLSGISQSAPSTTEFIIVGVVVVSMQIAQAMTIRVRRDANAQASEAARNIREIDVELRRASYQRRYE